MVSNELAYSNLSSEAYKQGIMSKQYSNITFEQDDNSPNNSFTQEIGIGMPVDKEIFDKMKDEANEKASE